MASGTLPQKNALKRQLFSSISQQQLAQELPHLHHNISFHARKAQFSCTLDNENCFQAHVKSIPNHHGKNIEKWNTNPPSSEHTYCEYRCLGPAALREKAGPERIEASKGPGEVCPRVVHILDKVRGRIEVPLLQQRKLTLTKPNSKTTSTGITMTTKIWHPAQTKCHKTPLDLRWVQFHDARLHSQARAHKYLCQPWLLPKCL
jgi:hypothetical protein